MKKEEEEVFFRLYQSQSLHEINITQEIKKTMKVHKGLLHNGEKQWFDTIQYSICSQ